jgi:molybdopterin-guanine dinucleotide biosynthesis protein A
MNTDAAIGIVLAGGDSSRMGRSKPWLDVDGRPLLLLVVDVVRRACERTVVVARAETNLPELPEAVERLEDPAECPEHGPLAATLAGLEHASRHSLGLAVLVGCDQLFVSAAHIDSVLEPLIRRPRCQACVAVTPGNPPRVHPLGGALRVEPARTRARALLEAKTGALRALYTELGAVQLPSTVLPDPRIVAPCNTPEEWTRALADYLDRSR